MRHYTAQRKFFITSQTLHEKIHAQKLHYNKKFFLYKLLLLLEKFNIFVLVNVLVKFLYFLLIALILKIIKL